MLEQIFLKVLNMSFTACFVILFVLVARLLLKKAPKIFSYALWAVVFFRLVCPFSFKSVLSLLPSGTDPIPQNIAYMAVPKIDSGFVAVDNSINSVLPAPSAEDSVNPMQIFISAAAYIWLIVLLGLCVYSLVTFIALKKRLSSAEWERENIYTFDDLGAPFVVGLLRPKIYLPAGISPQEKQFILEHERTHIKRFDPLVKAVGFAALCLHWFNPLCFLSYMLMTRDMELSCDESVIKKLGSDIKPDYSTSLLSFATGHKLMGTPLAFGESNVKSRVQNVLNYKKPAFWVIALAVVAVVAVCVGLMTSPKGAPSIVKNPESNLVIASAALENGFDLQLVMLEGHGYTADAQDFENGLYSTNHEGEYELQVLKNGEIVSKIDSAALLAPSFNKSTLNFSDKFDFSFEDYNTDGDIDFAIGQWASSRTNSYMLFSVDSSGKIRTLEVLDGLTTSDKDFSPLFRKVADDAFEFGLYNETLGGNALYTATWNSARFEIVQHELPQNPIKWLQTLSPQDVAAIELTVAPSARSEQYKKYPESEIADIVSFLNKSKGEFLPYNENIEGSIETFYITLKNGDKHSVSNCGNVYLVIDGQFYKGDDAFFAQWNYKGDSEIPDTFYRDPTPTPIVLPGEIAPQDFVNDIVKSFKINNGVASVTIPKKSPEGYSIDQLTVHITGRMPIASDGSGMSLHAFEAIDSAHRWELGKEHTEKMFAGAVPNNTEVYINVSLLEADGASSFYKGGNSKVFPLRDDTTVPNVKITANSVSFTDKFGDSLTLDISLPTGLSMVASGGSYEGHPSLGVVIVSGGAPVGSISCQSFDLNEDFGDSIPYLAVYNQIMLGSMATWDNEYTEIAASKTSATATCKPLVRVNVPGVSAAALPFTESLGILSYDASLKKYVAIEFDNGSLTDAQLRSTAKSVKLS